MCKIWLISIPENEIPDTGFPYGVRKSKIGRGEDMTGDTKKKKEPWRIIVFIISVPKVQNFYFISLSS